MKKIDLSDETTDQLSVNGSLSIDASFAIVKIKGSASVDIGREGVNKSKTFYIEHVNQRKFQKWNYWDIEEKDIRCPKDTKITHIVTGIFRGTSIMAQIYAEEKKSDSHTKIEGEMEVNLAN